MKEWDAIWKTEEGRTHWLAPEPFVLSLLPRFKHEGLNGALDLGCGLGRHSILLAQEGFRVCGMDTSPAGLEFALHWAEQENVAFGLVLAEMGQLPFAGDSFHLILAWNVIYHGTMEYIQRTVAEVERCLRPGGYLLCSLISTTNDQCGLGQEIEKGTYCIPDHKEKNFPHHYFDRAEIEALLRRFSVLECEDVPGGRPGSYHWEVLGRLDGQESEAL